MMKKLKVIFVLFFLVLHFTPSFAWDGMPTPPLHVEGRFLKDPCGNNVLLHGWMQPIETWFNGGGNRYSNPTNWTDPNNVAGMLNYLNEVADVMSDPTPKYGREHGWYASFVRINTDFIGGWTQQNGLVDESQFEGWIQNFLVPYADHLRSRGLYLVVCATGPMMTPNNGAQNAGVVEQQRLRTFWSTVANAPGVKNADNIMFELMNEPVQIESSPGNGQWGSGSSTYFQAFRDWMQPVIDDVRATGANNVCWVPCLGWQGEPHGWAEYPFTGSNVGVAAHYYPAYGGVYDNATAVQNLWNRNYKPAADRWPMIITESYWFPGGTGYDDLFNGTTQGFGNALRNAMDNQGNVSYLVGFIGDHLEDLYEDTPQDCSLGSRDATQSYFSWLTDYIEDAPGEGCGCTQTPITPYVQVNGGTWEQMSNVTVAYGDQVMLGPQPLNEGSWSWTGCATSGSEREQTFEATSSCIATATYTNECDTRSTQQFNITVTYEGVFSFLAQHSGKAIDLTNGGTGNGTNIQQLTYDPSSCNQQFQVTHVEGGWHRISPVIENTQALDVSGVSTANGATIQTWSWLEGNNQQWKFEDDGNGHLKIVVRHSNKCLDVDGVSTADGANIHQWTCIANAQNQSFELVERDNTALQDADGDGILDCVDAYPNDYDNDGVATNDDCDDTNDQIGEATTWYQDTDNDGVGASVNTQVSCTQPQGYVATAGDECPNDINKTTPGNCGCGNTEESCLDCAGTPNGTAFLDNCDNCVATQQEACEQDCNGDWGGTAVIDACNECTGGNTGLPTVTDPTKCVATGIEGYNTEKLLVYPNPTKGEVYLQERSYWKLMDITGNVLTSGYTDQVNLESYSPGMYYLNIEDELIKVIKE